MTIETRDFLIATKNEGKIKEIKNLLENTPLRLRGLNEFPNVLEPEEKGVTFAENAVIKANSYALQTGLCALADDSGLEVEALNNAPGVFSARYAGANASEEKRIEKLLKELNKTWDKNRRARFVCAMAIADENGEIKFVEEGVCEGVISLTASGKGGFGYDPIFIPDGFSRTFGELSADVKQEISHRARALNKIIEQLRRFHHALS